MNDTIDLLTPHEWPARIAIYGSLAALVVVPLVILLRKRRYRRAAWWNHQFNFRAAKERESDPRSDGGH